MKLNNVFVFVQKSNYFIFELFIIVRLVALIVPNVSKSLLIQDKICLFKYEQDDEFCLRIHQDLNWTTEQVLIKDHILAEATQFIGYTRNMIDSLAMVIWSLFVGSFLDKFKQSTTVIMSLNVGSDILLSIVQLLLIYFYDSSPYYLLIASSSAWFSGSIMAFNSAAYRYITVNTEEQFRAIKFVILEIIFVIDVSFSTYLGGQLVYDRTSNSSSIQLRTYELNYYLTLILDLFLIILLCVFYRFEVQNRITNEQSQEPPSCNSSKSIEIDCSMTKRNFVQILFDIENVKQTMMCFIKDRPNRVRLQIRLLIICLFNQVLVTNGLNSVLLQFFEKVYQWNAKEYSTNSAIQQITQMTILALLLPILVRMLRLSNITMIMLSQLAIFFMDLIRGIVLEPFAFFISLPIGSLAGLGAISVKNQIASIIPEHEVGKIFSISCTIEALVPFAASLVYSIIFTISIGSFPGMIYLFSCLIMILSLFIMAIVRFYYFQVQSTKISN
ncbi:hypothetical protein BLOT_005779 [Blomia tropicalis]|nr:hypothetical protein BLOT_005779 [Blomia tropicalis]